MGRKANFVGELESISHNVEEDVGRVITLLRDTQGKPVLRTQGDTAQTHNKQPPKDIVASITADTTLISGNIGHEQLPLQSPVSDRTVLENVTTRLTRETNERLSEAALRQKLAKRKPDTRQDIVEEAVREWLGRNDFHSA